MLCAVVWVLCAFVCASAHADADRTQEPAVPSDEGPVAETPAGRLRGAWLETRRGRRFEAYRGLRYAEPPVGALRFQPPQPIRRYRGEQDARADGPACPQPTYGDYYVDEDCLRLNVYTPGGNRSGLLPVVIFMHAGGFYSVSGRSDVAGPGYLLDRDIVLVTINYRLASLGFLSTGDALAPGNNGFKDQVAAMRWVRRNIRALGGDPACVTLAGYSAGSLSVALHMVSPMSRGLFHRAISMSASPLSQVVIGGHQRALAERQARLLGCPTNTTRAILDCLNTKTSKELGDSLDGMFEFGYDPVLIWNAVIEPDFGQERFLTEQPLRVITEGRAHAVPYIVSQTHDEFFWKAFNVQNNASLLDTMNAEWERIAPISFMLPERGARAAAARLREFYLAGRPVGADAASAAGLGKLYSDSVIGFAAHRMANLMCRRSPHPVYYYQFGYVGGQSHYVDPDTSKPIGAAHHDDLIYLFTLTASFRVIPLDSPDNEIVDKITAIWYNFARYGDPNPRGDTPELAGLAWPAMTPARRTYLRIDKPLSLHTDMFHERFRLWDELYPIEY